MILFRETIEKLLMDTSSSSLSCFWDVVNEDGMWTAALDILDILDILDHDRMTSSHRRKESRSLWVQLQRTALMPIPQVESSPCLVVVICWNAVVMKFNEIEIRQTSVLSLYVSNVSLDKQWPNMTQPNVKSSTPLTLLRRCGLLGAGRSGVLGCRSFEWLWLRRLGSQGLQLRAAMGKRIFNRTPL